MANNNRRSALQFGGIERSLRRAWAKGAGLIDEEFARPMIAVVNTYQDFSPENVHLRQVREAVCAGVRMAGGTPCAFNTFHVMDSETFASVGMRYVLPSRDVVADMIELMVEGHRFDALVLIGSGDKVMPGMVMAVARLDLPAIMIYGGSTAVGLYQGRKVFLETVYDGVGEHIRGALSAQDLKGLEDNHFPFSGGCDIATFGNTAGIYAEALGLALPGTATLPAGSNYQLRAAKCTGIKIMELLAGDIRPSRILPARLRERHAGGHGGRRLDQHGAAFHGDGDGSGRRRLFRHLGRAVALDADARQARAVRPMGRHRTQCSGRRSGSHESAGPAHRARGAHGFGRDRR